MLKMYVACALTSYIFKVESTSESDRMRVHGIEKPQMLQAYSPMALGHTHKPH